MSNTRSFLTSMTCSLLLWGCHTKFEQETALFGRYLQTTLHQDLAKEKTVYLLLPSTQCEACGQKLGADVVSPGIPLVVIAGFKTYNPAVKIVTDYSGEMDRLPFLPYANKMVLVEGQKIRAIQPYADTTSIRTFYAQQ